MTRSDRSGDDDRSQLPFERVLHARNRVRPQRRDRCDGRRGSSALTVLPAASASGPSISV